MNKRNQWVLVVLMGVGISAVSAGEYTWIEAELPTAITPPVKAEVLDWNRGEIMSGGKLLYLNVSAKDAAKALGANGGIFTYEFSIAGAGKHQVWARVGFERVRSNFDWRIDKGAWNTCQNTDLTVDLYSIVAWRELAWIHLGDQKLAAGKHRLEIRHTPQTKKDKKGVEKPARTLAAFDSFCIAQGEFRPNGKHKPDANFQSKLGKEAAKKVYELSASKTPGARTEVVLNGAWQIARWDEFEVDERRRLLGAKALPTDLDQLYWYGITAPSDAKKLEPFVFSHRIIYRTKIKVPAALKGRGFFLDFQDFNMLATVFVNGEKAGWSKTHTTGWQCDITPYVKPGAVNDLAIVIKSTYYGITKGVRQNYNLPRSFMAAQSGAMMLDMAVQSDRSCGILAPLTLVATGAVYTTDVFAKTSVKKKTLGLEITVLNPGKSAAKITIQNKIVPWNRGKGGKAEKRFAAKTIKILAGKFTTIDLSESWKNPRLWWPDDPQLYWVLTRITQGDKVLDLRKTRFGFREWDWSTHLFKLNGVNWQMWADTNYGATPQTFIERCKTSGMNNYRLWMGGRKTWGGMYRREILNYMDEQGMPVRSSGVFDGQGYFYSLSMPDPQNPKKRIANKPLFDNWRHQMRAWVKEERNHPSIYIWSIENEIAFINSWNGGQWSYVEPELRKGAAEVEALDPTRPTMVDGGRALMDQSMPVNGAHYNDLAGINRRDLPDGHYTAPATWAKTMNRGKGWPMAPNKPQHHGECFFANGWRPSQFAAIGGDKCFIGLSETMGPRSLYAKMMSEAYRWSEVAAWHMWLRSAKRGYYNAWQPVCVFVRQWNWTFGSTEKVTRTLAVFNSTRHKGPIEMSWSLVLDGKKIAGETKTYPVAPGEKEVVEISFTLPKISRRVEGEFILTCSRGGKEVFREVKSVSVINPDAAPKAKISKGKLFVIDPHGSAIARLKKRGVPFVTVKKFADVPASAKMLIVGKDAISKTQSTSYKWRALASRGCRILVLEQAYPLHYQAVPADLEVTDYVGRIAFVEDMNHPAFVGLKQKDFFTWSNDHIVYRNAYKKAAKGGRSLVQCDEELGYSAVTECPTGDGLLLLSQLVIGEKLETNAVATRVFDQMVNTIASFKPLRKETVIVMDATTPTAKMLKRLEVTATTAKDPLRALALKKGITVIAATPKHLKTLAAARDAVNAYCKAGGWIMLMGLTPDGLADYNKIVGFNHAIRPFQMERVVYASPRDPLTSGLTFRDMVLDTGQKVNSWESLMMPANDQFKFIVDYDEIGAFVKLPSAEAMGKPPEVCRPGFDHWPPNMVNGFTTGDSWKWSYMIALDRGDLTKWTMELPKEEEITNFSIIINTIYHKISKINLYFDDDPKPFAMTIKPSRDRQDFTITGKKAKRITLEIADWEKSGRANVIGIDCLWIGVKRSPEFYQRVKSMLNIGGLLRYSIGRGGIVLNQINVLEREANPVNLEKKANITKVLLKNLGAVFGGAKSVVVGSGLTFSPLKLQASQKFNAYLSRTGKPRWFGNGIGLEHLPSGRNKYGGIPYEIADFTTSQVPGVVMLSGPGSHLRGVNAVSGIPIGRKADALFFLHTLNATRVALRWQAEQERRKRNDPRPLVFQYIVHYADGKQVKISVRWDEGVQHWLREKPGGLIKSGLAWAAAAKDDTSGKKACLYSLQWTNPHPKKVIKTIDLVYGEKGKRYGTPALIAITAAQARK